MNLSPGFLTLCALMPSLLMLGVLLPLQFRSLPATKHWQAFTVLSGIALIFTMVTPFLAASPTQSQPWLLQTTLGAGLTLLVQFLGTIIGAFIISTLTNGLRILSVPQEWQMVVTGAIVILAVYADIIRRRK